jgi:hypothetical protein
MGGDLASAPGQRYFLCVVVVDLPDGLLFGLVGNLDSNLLHAITTTIQAVRPRSSKRTRA